MLKDKNPQEVELWHLPEEGEGVGGTGGGQGRRGRVTGEQQVQGNLGQEVSEQEYYVLGGEANQRHILSVLYTSLPHQIV